MEPIVNHMKVNAQTKNSSRKLKPAAVLYWLGTGLAALGLAWGIATKTPQTVAVLAAILSLLIVRKNMVLGLAAVLFLPVIGELYRLPFGGENGILVSDIAAGAVVAVWAFEKITKRKPVETNDFLKPLAVFFGIALFSLVLSLTFLKLNEVLAGSLYLFRFVEYVLLGVITADIVRTRKDAQKLLTAIVTVACVIAAAGFVQLAVYPDLGKLEEYGWDPHINRLVSTWLDPNFIAGYLSFIIAIVTAVALYTKNVVKKTGLIAILGILAIALFLTYSRSGYVAAAASLGIIGILKSRKLLVAGIIIFIVGLNFLPRAQERVDDLVHSVQSFVFSGSENPDPTARLRIVSWNQTLELIAKRPLLGSGYNTLKYVKYNEGFVEDPSVHSASGSDSSLLTILATTGILGLLPFLLLHWNMLKLSYQNWRNKTVPLQWQGYGLGVFAGLVGLLFHSLFVNSLLFPQILIPLWISAGLLAQKTSTQKNAKG